MIVFTFYKLLTLLIVIHFYKQLLRDDEEKCGESKWKGDWAKQAYRNGPLRLPTVESSLNPPQNLHAVTHTEVHISNSDSVHSGENSNRFTSNDQVVHMQRMKRNQ